MLVLKRKNEIPIGALDLIDGKQCLVSEVEVSLLKPFLRDLYLLPANVDAEIAKQRLVISDP